MTAGEVFVQLGDGYAQVGDGLCRLEDFSLFYYIGNPIGLFKQVTTCSRFKCWITFL